MNISFIFLVTLGNYTTPISPYQVALSNRYEALEAEKQSKDGEGEDPSRPEILPGSERPTPHIETTGRRKKRWVLVVGDYTIGGTEDPICRRDPPLREACCLPGARVKDVTRSLPSLV